MKLLQSYYQTSYKEISNSIKDRFKGQFARNLFTVGTGTTIAQLIPLLASPLLTRIFSPSEFGVFAVFTSIMSVLVVINSGKYENAIILPGSHEEAINIVGLCTLLTLISVFLFSVLFYFTDDYLGGFLKIDNIGSWLWLVPLGSLLASLYLILNEWYIRKNNFIGLSKNRIANTSAITGSGLLFGFIKINLGLIYGQIAGQCISVYLALKAMLKTDIYLFKYISFSKMAYFAKRYIDFSRFVIPGQLLNNITGLLSIAIITSKIGIFEAGLIALVDRVFGVPSSIMGSAVRDVFKLRAISDYQQNGNCIDIYKKVSLLLALVSILPFLILFITAPMLFTFIFGEDWFLAGSYARILSLMYLLNFISMPTGWLFVVAEKQKYEFIWQIIFLALTVIPLFLGSVFLDARSSIILWGTGRSVSYIIYFYMTWNIARGKL